MVLIAHVSDTHLGYKQYNLDEREDDFSKAFEEFTEKVLEDHVRVVVHSGDMFDSFRPSVKALYTAKAQLKKLREKGVKVYAVLGDHDFPKRRGMPPHRLFEEELTLLGVEGGGGRKGCVIKADGREVYIGGVVNMTRRHRDVLLEELSRIVDEGKGYWRSVVVMHQAINIYMSYDFQLEVGEIPVGASYYAMGHLHGRRKMTLGGGILAYAGSTEITRRDEIDEWRRNGKGFYLVDLSGDLPEVQPVNLDVRPQFEIELRYEQLKEDVEKVVRELGGRKPVVHVRVTGSGIDRRVALEVLEKVFSGKVLHWRPEFEDEAEREFKLSSWKTISHKELLSEILGGDIAEFAWELFNALRGGREGMDEAKRLVEKFFREGSW
ncbi:MAG: exonuclease SbcCD subunit D [Candidatus Jordarchaeales archaeon]